MNISAIPLLVLFISWMSKSMAYGSQAATPYATTYWIAPAASVYGSSYGKNPKTVTFKNSPYQPIYGTTYDLTPTSGSASGQKLYATSYWTQPSAFSGSEQSKSAAAQNLYATSYWTPPSSGYGASRSDPSYILYATSYYRQPEYMKRTETSQAATSHGLTYNTANTLPVNSNKQGQNLVVTGEGLPLASAKEPTATTNFGSEQILIQDAVSDGTKHEPSQTTKGLREPLETGKFSTGNRQQQGLSATGSDVDIIGQQQGLSAAGFDVDKSATGTGRMQDKGNSATEYGTGQGAGKSSTGHKKTQRPDEASARNAANKKKSRKTRIVKVFKRIKVPQAGSGIAQGAKRVAARKRSMQGIGNTSSKSGALRKLQDQPINSPSEIVPVP